MKYATYSTSATQMAELSLKMASHLDMKDLAVGVADHEEDIETERDRLHAEEVTGPQVPGMPLEKFPPAG